MRQGFKSKYLEPGKLAKIKNLQLLARTVVEGYISGLHRSPFKGFSSEFAEYRQYLHGDDLKHFDWKLYARSDKSYVRQYEEETNMSCTILLDASGSMGFGSAADGEGEEKLTKFHYACCLVAALTYLMIQQRDQVGLAIFDEGVRQVIPPRNSPAHMKRILEQLERAEPGGGTGIARSLHKVAERVRRRGLVILLSDLVEGPADVMNALSHFRHDRHEVLVFNLFDRAEVELPYDGLVEFEDMETGTRMQVRTDVIRDEYRGRFDDFVRHYRESCAAARVDYHLATTDTPFELMLAAYLRRRESYT